jgi:hypothetical protein
LSRERSPDFVEIQSTHHNGRLAKLRIVGTEDELKSLALWMVDALPDYGGHKTLFVGGERGIRVDIVHDENVDSVSRR